MPVRAGHRIVTAALAAAMAGAAPLAAGVAFAQPTGAEGGRQVTFSGGGVGLLLCTSEPDRGRLNVAARSTVTFVNRTGGQAVLRVDGQDAASIGPDQAVPVVFHRGPVAVSMVPRCGLSLNQRFGTVTVEVTAASKGTRGTTNGTTTPPGPARQPVDQATTPAEVDAGDLPAAGATLPSGSGNVVGVADSDNTVVTDDVVVSAPIAFATLRKGANGLLVVVAVICVIAVAAGAIRAIFAQRASRARAA